LQQKLSIHMHASGPLASKVLASQLT